MLAEQLANDHGFAVVTAGTLNAAEKAINDEGASFDAVILDLGMPDGNGRDYCVELRRQGHNMPVIMLTGSFSSPTLFVVLNQARMTTSPSRSA